MKITTDSTNLQNIVDKSTVAPVRSELQNRTSVKDFKPTVSEMTDIDGKPTKEAYQIAVNKMNEFMEVTNKNSKFIFHDGLDKYYVEIVDAKTDEVVKEIPPKELLDAYYEMQKMIGKIIDKTV